MKRLTAIILLFAITLQVCSKLVYTGLFTINRSEIAALFCINKQNPQTHCDGKCYLTKKMKETDSENQSGTSIPAKSKTSVEEVWICEHQKALFIPQGIEIQLGLAEPNSYLLTITQSIFQPPRA